MHGARVWLVTDDALLAEQATLEGLRVGFGWLASKLDPPVVASPHIDPRTLRWHHVPVRAWLEELLWMSDTIALQRVGEGAALHGRVKPSQRDRALHALGHEGSRPDWRRENAVVWDGPPAAPEVAPPAKAPPAQKLLQRLLSKIDGVATLAVEQEAERTQDAYLVALGWTDATGTASVRGADVASRWRSIRDDDVNEWVQWTEDAGRDTDRLGLLKSVLAALTTRPASTDDDLKKATGQALRTLQSVLTFSSLFGRSVRLDAKNWCAGSWKDDEAEEAVLAAVRTLIDASPSVGAAPIGRVFTSLLPKKGETAGKKVMSFQIFRGALARLAASNRISTGASSPERGLRVRALVRTGTGVDVREVDLGHGDFLLPGKPAAVAYLKGAS